MDKAFRTWTFNGTRFLAIDNRNARDSVAIIDEYGRNYGAWRTIESFRERQQKRPIDAQPIGNARLSMDSLPAR